MSSYSLTFADIYAGRVKNPDTLQQPQSESAAERRNRELDELREQGFPIVRISKWQSRIGPLHIWPYSGHWLNEATGIRGKLYSLSIRKLITGQGISKNNSSPVGGHPWRLTRKSENKQGN